MRILLLLLIPLVSIAAGPKVPLQAGAEPPPLLSETGLFLRMNPVLEPIPSLHHYEVNQALWVDYAQKQRFIYVPEKGRVEFSPAEAYAFPVGTIFVKHFRMEISRSVFRNIETRLLVKKEGTDKWEGFTYRWEDGDARLVGASERAAVPLSVDSTAPGGARLQNFKIPTRVQCLQCHNASLGFVRSFITPQLNRPEGMANQLERLSGEGLFDRELGSAGQYEAYAAIDDLSQSLAKRAKSYLDVNCAHCHNPKPEAMCNFTGLDFRFGMIKVDELAASGHLVPGKKDDSEIFSRMGSVRPFERMPFIGSDIRDETALSVIGQWIDSMLN